MIRVIKMIFITQEVLPRGTQIFSQGNARDILFMQVHIHDFYKKTFCSLFFPF